MFVNNHHPSTIIRDFSDPTSAASTTLCIATALVFCIIKILDFVFALDHTLPRRRLAVAAGAMADEMDWQVDTPPKIFFQSTRPFSPFARRRTFEDFAEGRRVEYSRARNPEPALPDATLYDDLAHSASNTTPLGNPLVQPEQVYGYGWDQPSYLAAITNPISYSEWIAGRQHLYVNQAKAYRYLRQAIDTIGYGIVAAARSETMRTFCHAGFHAGRYLFTGNPRITHTYVAVAQAANGAKRRVIDITRRSKPRHPYRNILLSPEQRRYMRYRERLRSSRYAKDENRFWSRFTEDPMEGVEATMPNPLYCMSGALQATESDTPVRNPPFVPGEWVSSPEQVLQTPRLAAFYDPNSPDSVNESDHLGAEWPQNAAFQHNTLSPAPQTEFGSIDSTATAAYVGHNACSNTVKDETTAPNNSQNADVPAFTALEDNNDGRDNAIDSPVTPLQAGMPIPQDVSPPSHESHHAVPIRTTCRRSDTGELDLTCVELQRAYENDERFKRYLEDEIDERSLLSLYKELQSSDTAIPDAPESSGFPIRPDVDDSIKDSPAHSYMASPVSALASPPTSFTPPMNPNAKSPKKRVQFYESPITGKPVDRLKRFIIGARIDESYDSSPRTEASLSQARHNPKNLIPILSSPRIPDRHETGPLFNSSATRERLLAMYPMESSSNGTAETPVTSSPAPSEAVSPSPSGQLIPEKPEAVSFEEPPLYKPPLSVPAQVLNGGVRRPGSNTFVVTADGSPMRLPSSSVPTSSAAIVKENNNPTLGKENSNAVADGISIKDQNNFPPTQIDLCAESSSPLPAAEALAHEVSSSSNKESESLPINDTSPLGSPENNNASRSQVDVSVESPPASLSSVGNMAHEQSSSSITESSSSFIPAGASPPKEHDSIASPGQVEALARSSSGSSAIDGTLTHERSSFPNKESSSTFMPAGASSPKEQDSIATPGQVDVSTDLLTSAPMVKVFSGLNISDRKGTLRSSSRAEREAQRRAEEEQRLAAEKARKEKEEAEEKARKAKEAAEALKKSGKRRMPLEKIIQPLSAEWDRRVDEALAEPMSKGLTNTSTGTTLTRRDLGKILPQAGVPGEDPRGWLNDDAVLAYLQAIVDHGLLRSGHKRGQTPSLHAFNTFFYNNLKSKGPDSIKRWAGKAKIGGKDLLKVEHVFIPVNHGGMHWTLLVVSPRYKRIEYFDSFHGDAGEVLSNAKKWLKQELGDAFSESEWKSVGKAGPRQTNGSDCGVFTVTTAKMIMLGVDPMAYSAADIPMQRRRMVAELLNRGLTGEFEPHVVFKEE